MTAEQVRADARAWIDDNWDEDITIREWLERLADSGWGNPTWAEGSFGRGLPNDLAPAAYDEFRKLGAPGPPAGLSRMLAAPTIIAHGTDEQIQRWVRGILVGDESWCQLFSEPGAGSDLASLQTRAVRDGDEWIVTGQKVWTSGGQNADLGMLIARTNPEVPKHSGISWFAFEMDQPGVEVRPLRQMTGGSSFCEVFMTEARVPHENIIGGLNNGWAATLTTLANERVGLGGGGAAGGFAAPAPGGRRAQEALQEQVGAFAARVRERMEAGGGSGRGRRRGGGRGGGAGGVIALAKQHGKHTDPVIRQKLVELHTLNQLSRFNTLRSKAAVAAGQRPGAESSIGKLLTSRITRANRDLTMEILGAHGTITGPDAPAGGMYVMGFLQSPAPSIYGGSDEIQKNIVGERVLGLPKEPDPYKDAAFKDLKVGTQRSTD
jgi:alkylation response protein AidB-like acyl-CoA dehydrogenase